MYRAFNSIFYHKMEKPFLEFAEEVTGEGDTICLIVSLSPDTRYDKKTGLGTPADFSPLKNHGLQINIPRSVSAIAFSLSKTGGVRKVFAFVGNNDNDSPEWHHFRDLAEPQDYYEKARDPTSKEIIELFKREGYKMWHPQLNNKIGRASCRERV